MTQERPEGPSHIPLVAAAGQYMGYGLTWALSTAFFFFIGWWADGKLGTRPLLAILGAFVGGTAGFYSLYRHISDSGSGEDSGSDAGDEEAGTR